MSVSACYFMAFYCKGGNTQEVSAGLTSLTSAVGDTIVPMVGQVWSLITGNPLLTAFAAVGLLGVGISVFRRVKRASR